MKKMLSIVSTPIIKFEKIHFHSILDYFIFICFEIFVLMDFFTGLLLSMGLPSIGVPFKLVLMILIFLSIKKENKYLFIFYLIALTSICSLTYFFSNIADLTESISMILKIMMYPFLLLYIEDTYDNLDNGKRLIKRICLLNLYVIFFNQILGILGFGLSTYATGGSFGIKGFFFDGNAMAVVCFCLFVFFYSIDRQPVLALMMVFSSFILGTKTSLLAITLYFFIYSFLTSKRRTKKYILLLFSIVIFLMWHLINNTDLFTFHVEKIKRLYDVFDGHILSVILSGRDVDLATHYKIYKEHFNLTTFLFGDGYLKSEKTIELDFFDTLFSYGSLFCLPVVFAYLYVILRNRKNISVTIFNVLIVVITFTSGHIWYNTSTALFFVINNLYGRLNLNEKNLVT